MITNEDINSFFNAVESAQIEQLKTLLAMHPDLINVQNDDLKTALHIAVQNNHLETVECLIEHKADINIQTGYKGKYLKHIAPILYAAKTKNFDLFFYLVKKNADINIRGKYDNSILHYATMGGNLNIMNFLVDNTNINATNKGRQTALHISVLSGNLETVKFLIENNADLEKTTRGGETALHLAITRGQLEIVKLLVKNNANINATIKNGTAAFNLIDNSFITRALKIHMPSLTEKNNQPLKKLKIFLSIRDELALAKIQQDNGKNLHFNTSLASVSLWKESFIRSHQFEHFPAQSDKKILEI